MENSEKNNSSFPTGLCKNGLNFHYLLRLCSSVRVNRKILLLCFLVSNLFLAGSLPMSYPQQAYVPLSNNADVTLCCLKLSIPDYCLQMCDGFSTREHFSQKKICDQVYEEYRKQCFRAKPEPPPANTHDSFTWIDPNPRPPLPPSTPDDTQQTNQIKPAEGFDSRGTQSKDYVLSDSQATIVITKNGEKQQARNGSSHPLPIWSRDYSWVRCIVFLFVFTRQSLFCGRFM
ncbi:uncharacterized protein LOC134841339 [Symsagittifera roscoffensis]|uniref:uncharacterized protein LOC134841339 n=1 Tax=Symsagittifera roscoffensis TaxID=84072 RepID=UPI00307B11E9